jgi:hypothetical protein
MTEKTCWESLKAEGSSAFDKLKDLVHEGNVRRIRVRQGERTIAEFPLTAGVVGAVIAPALAAIGALVALAKDCSIEIEREAAAAAPPATRDTPAA